jgi:ATP-dependent Clp protease adaptor protein ClpS
MNTHRPFSTLPVCQDQDHAADAPSTDSPADAVVAVLERPAPQPTLQKPPVDELPMWKILLHNDDKNDMDHVVESIVMLTPLDAQEAVIRMTEAHKTGVALLMVTHKEKAELVQEQFASRSLIVTIEPDGK